MAAKIVTLTCSTCGALITGRQWHNRDAGYGICARCFKWVSMREAFGKRETPEQIQRC